MALPPGREDDRRAGPVLPLRVLFATGRLVGFLLLAVPAMAILAAVVLIPELTQLRALEYERDTEKACKADLDTALAAYNRLNHALLEDETLVKRLAMTEWNLQPRNEYVSSGGPIAYRPVGAITPFHHPRPAPPSGWLTSLTARLDDPAKKRGLLLLAAGALLAAMFLFSPPEKYARAAAGA